jgi:hypothetical protein
MARVLFERREEGDEKKLSRARDICSEKNGT